MLGNLRVAITALLASYWLRNVDRNPRRNHEWQKSDNHRLGAEPPVVGTGHGPDKKGGLLSYWLHVGPSLEQALSGGGGLTERTSRSGNASAIFGAPFSEQNVHGRGSDQIRPRGNYMKRNSVAVLMSIALACLAPSP
jgi:hypothetical protein